MVEDGKYEFFPWGNGAFSKLMASLRQKIFVEKQFYRLGGIPHILNVWMFKICSNVEIKVVVKDDLKCKDLKRVMNDKFSEVLKSLHSKNDTVDKEDIAKWSPKEVEHSDEVVDVAGYSNPISPHNDSDKQDLDVIFYYLRKKYKHKNFSTNRYTTIDCFFKVYIDKAYMNYYYADIGKKLSTQDSFAWTYEVAQIEMSLINTIRGLSTPAGQPWHLVNEVFVPINCDDTFHWVLIVIVLKERSICMYDSMYSSRNSAQTSEIQKLAIMLPTYLQYSNFFSERDCGVFIAIFVEYLSEGLGTLSSDIDAQYHRLRYATLLCKYGSEKAKNGYFSENDDPPRQRSIFTPKEKDSVLHIE
ncbi:hypothetical protein CQW23_12452 [Capsicum baccatum]|uniref:Ubiquitin-like protease family profile domain-containing protein n=1 Tax=Capsicum baccatum TaxID=33114 RepID=A0A2G2WSM8_CAPBA|nr:hypothetical protein CQW23_12452 [Capsicum baccatum]